MKRICCVCKVVFWTKHKLLTNTQSFCSEHCWLSLKKHSNDPNTWKPSDTELYGNEVGVKHDTK